jgi:hypothetical protein
MKRLIPMLSVVVLISSAAPAVALNPGTDVLVPAAGRGGVWVTDLYVMNPNEAPVNGTLFWLIRDQSNPNPVSVSFTLEPGETRVLADVIREEFGINSGGGAFRVTADAEVVVNSRIYALDGDKTFGQGFEGVPAPAATAAGQTSDIVGLSHVSGAFRTNFYALAGSDGASMVVTLLDPEGDVLATSDLELEPYEPYLKRINQTVPTGDFSDGTVRVTVNAGSAVVGASKVDEMSTDPTTLESSTPLGVAAVDGTYEFKLADSDGFASGGDLVIESGRVVALNGTFSNWDKDDDADTRADCPLLFKWGLGLPDTDVAEFADGVSFSDSYEASGSGVMTWTLSFTVADGMTVSGALSAVGSGFPSAADPNEDQSGCNGSFPELVFAGGKTD